MVDDARRRQIGPVGHGEVGRILAEDLRQEDIQVATFDIKRRRVAFWRGSSADV